MPICPIPPCRFHPLMMWVESQGGRLHSEQDWSSAPHLLLCGCCISKKAKSSPHVTWMVRARGTTHLSASVSTPLLCGVARQRICALFLCLCCQDAVLQPVTSINPGVFFCLCIMRLRDCPAWVYEGQSCFVPAIPLLFPFLCRQAVWHRFDCSFLSLDICQGDRKQLRTCRLLCSSQVRDSVRSC